VMGMPLRAEDERVLRIYGAAVEPYYCHLCGACEGSCPRGVEISTVNRALMYEEGYGSRRLSLATYREIPASAGADACLDCSGCVARCIRGLDITAKMDRARQLFG